MAYRGVRVGPVFGLSREIDRLFEDTFGRDNPRAAFTPPVDIREAGDELLIEVELPGLRPDDVDVTAENGVLTIRGDKRNTSADTRAGRYHVTERSYGAFARSFQLPSGVDEQRIDAEFVDGVLVVHVPKAVVAQPRRIEIRGGGSRSIIQGTTIGTPSAGGPRLRPADASDTVGEAKESPRPNTDSPR